MHECKSYAPTNKIPTNTGETRTKKHTMSSWLDSHDGRKTSLHPALVVKISKISYTPQTNKTMEKTTMNEYVSPIQNDDVPMSC